MRVNSRVRLISDAQTKVTGTVVSFEKRSIPMSMRIGQMPSVSLWYKVIFDHESEASWWPDFSLLEL